MLDVAVRKKRLDLTRVMKAADDLLEKTENPLHRAILQNYRRHALLEIAGRWEEILLPGMMADEPHYRIMTPAGTNSFKGKSEVANFYRAYAGSGMSVFGAIDDSEIIAVADWGFASEALFGHITPGRFMGVFGLEADNIDATYFVTHRVAMVWPYDKHGRCAGEWVYDDLGSYAFEEMDAADIITPAEATSIVNEMLESRTFTIID